MTNHDPKLTIFISSMIGPLWHERAAVEKAIKTGIPLARPWVFERAPASSEEITESYLARVRECDIYLLILGDDVSDPVKAEYQTAVECDKPRLCFVQEDVKRTEALEEFLPTLQADVKYATFTDRESLQREVLRAVQQELVLAHKHYRLGEAERDQLAASIGLPPSESVASLMREVERIQNIVDHNLQLRLDDTPQLVKKMPVTAFETAFGGDRRLGVSERLLQAVADYLGFAASINLLVDRYENQIRSGRGTDPLQIGVPGSSRSSYTIQQIQQEISKQELCEALEKLRIFLREESRQATD